MTKFEFIIDQTISKSQSGFREVEKTGMQIITKGLGILR